MTSYFGDVLQTNVKRRNGSCARNRAVVSDITNTLNNSKEKSRIEENDDVDSQSSFDMNSECNCNVFPALHRLTIGKAILCSTSMVKRTIFWNTSMTIRFGNKGSSLLSQQFMGGNKLR